MTKGITNKREPKVLRHGRCYQCGGERGPIAQLHDDPFCKSDCCRAFYAGEPRETSKTPKPKASKKAKEEALATS